jgi:DsbC/DsbD-like thiol-disulfide interchange protein
MYSVLVLLKSLAPALLAAAVLAQAPPGPAPGPGRSTDAGRSVSQTRHLTVTTSASTISAAPGASATLFVDVAPKPGMHVYAPDQKEYIPIALTLTAAEAFRATPPRFPVSEKLFFAPLNETQRVYSKPFRIVQPVTLARAVAAAAITIAGTVRYQACDDAICYVPQSVPISWTITVAP